MTRSKLLNEQKEFNLDKDYYPSDFVHLLVISAIESRPFAEDEPLAFPSVSKKVAYNQYLKEWKVARVYQSNDNDYSCFLCINHDSGQAILVHKKNQLMKYLFDNFDGSDLTSALYSNIEQYQKESYDSTKSLVAWIQENYPGYHLSTAGCAIGGMLAELSVYFCRRDFDINQIKAVTFDSPGISDNFYVYKSKILECGDLTGFGDLNITTYLSTPNFINTCNDHIGKVYRVFPRVTDSNISKAQKLFQDIHERLQLLKIPDDKNINRDIVSSSLTKIKDLAVQNKYNAYVFLSSFGHNINSLIKEFNPNSGNPYYFQKVEKWPKFVRIDTYENFHKFKSMKNFELSLPNVIESFVTIFTKSMSFQHSFDVYKKILKAGKTYHCSSKSTDHYVINDSLCRLSYKGDYCTKTVNSKKEHLCIQDNNAGFYLRGLKDCSLERWREFDLEGLYNSVRQIKDSYDIISFQKQSLIQSKDLNVSQIVNRINNAIEISSSLREYLEGVNKKGLPITEGCLSASSYEKIGLIKSNAKAIYNKAIKLKDFNHVASLKLYKSSLLAFLDFDNFAFFSQRNYSDSVNSSLIGQKVFLADVTAAIGKKYFELSDLKKAVICYLQALKICKSIEEQGCLTKKVAKLKCELARTFDFLKMHRLAVKYYKESISEYKKIGDTNYDGIDILSKLSRNFINLKLPEHSIKSCSQEILDICSTPEKFNSQSLFLITGRLQEQYRYLENTNVYCENAKQILDQVSVSIKNQNSLIKRLEPDLNKVEELVQQGKWNSGYLTSFSPSFYGYGYNYGVKGYVADEYIKKQLGNIYNNENLRISKILFLEKICSVVSANPLDKEAKDCLINFVNINGQAINDVQNIMEQFPSYFTNYKSLQKSINLLNDLRVIDKNKPYANDEKLCVLKCVNNLGKLKTNIINWDLEPIENFIDYDTGLSIFSSDLDSLYNQLYLENNHDLYE